MNNDDESLVLTKEEWEQVRDEAEFIATYKGWSFSDAMKEAEVRVRKAVNKELK